MKRDENNCVFQSLSPGAAGRLAEGTIPLPAHRAVVSIGQPPLLDLNSPGEKGEL